jgi:teichuronic acid biosynthesis glycosyltransferase TuaH
VSLVRTGEVVPGKWDGLVVIAGGERFDGVRGSHRHLAEALSRRMPVLYVDPAVSPLTRFRPGGAAAGQPGLRLVHPGLALLVPRALPGLARPGIRVTTLALTRRAIRRALRSLGRPVVQALVVASLDDLFGACAARCRVMYATDDYVAGADIMSIGSRYLERCERRQAQLADRIVVVSEPLALRWRALGQDPVVIANGCDPDAYEGVDRAALPEDVDLPAPVAGVVGRLSSRIDLSLLEAVADRGTSLLLVGPRQASFEPDRVERLLARPNVVWVGEKPFEELPPYLRLIDVGLTPYGNSAFNRASFPLKTLEYLAAGCAVVATDLPAHRSLDTDLVVLADAPEAFADAVDRVLAGGSTPEAAAARRALARAHSWDARALEFAGVARRADEMAGRA